MSYLGMDTYVNADMAQKENSVTKVKAFLSHLQSLVLTLFLTYINNESIGFGYFSFHSYKSFLSLNNNLPIIALIHYLELQRPHRVRKNK